MRGSRSRDARTRSYSICAARRLAPVSLADSRRAPGQQHGYDVVDPTRINPELGTEARSARAVATSFTHAAWGSLVDIVPNHMGIGPENAYWEDVLTHGERSRYAKWFDIDWKTRRRSARSSLPVLGDELDEVIERGELARTRRGRHEQAATRLLRRLSFPIDSASLPPERCSSRSSIPTATSELADVYARPRDASGLRALLDAQHYRLAYWRSGPREINYRRFFDVNDLVGAARRRSGGVRRRHTRSSSPSFATA